MSDIAEVIIMFLSLCFILLLAYGLLDMSLFCFFVIVFCFVLFFKLVLLFFLNILKHLYYIQSVEISDYNVWLWVFLMFYQIINIIIVIIVIIVILLAPSLLLLLLFYHCIHRLNVKYISLDESNIVNKEITNCWTKIEW